MLTNLNYTGAYQKGTAIYWQNRKWPVKIAENLMTIGEQQEKEEQLLLESLHADDLNEIIKEAMTENLTDSYALEGERLDSNLIKSSIIESMGMDKEELNPKSQQTDKEAKAVSMTLSLMNNDSLTHEMIWKAHSFIEDDTALGYRKHGEQILARGNTVYLAPEEKYVNYFMDRFLEWWHIERLKFSSPVGSAIAHYVFVTIHPFRDGNGRMARALADKAMITSQESRYRPYSISTEILKERDEYAISLNNLNPDVFINFMLRCHSFCLKSGFENARQMQFARYFIQRGNFNDIEKKMIHKMCMTLTKNKNWKWEVLDFESINMTDDNQQILDSLDNFKSIGVLSKEGIFNVDWRNDTKKYRKKHKLV